MDGTARFQMQSANLSRLTEEAMLEGTFAVRKGIISGVDVVETARLRSKENLPGGRTHFDELSGNLYYANGDYHFRQVKMSAGVLNATGTLDVARQQVSGRVIGRLDHGVQGWGRLRCKSAGRPITHHCMRYGNFQPTLAVHTENQPNALAMRSSAMRL